MGTVRDPSDSKYAHLYKLEKALENLKLVKADLLDYDSLYSAIKGCNGVFHVASPVPSTILRLKSWSLLQKGTLNALKACKEANVRRVVVVSSGGAVAMNSNWPKDQVMDGSCWSGKDYFKTTQNWYHLSKTEAEIEAFEYAKKSGLDVVTVFPTLALGPIQQSTMNASTMVFINRLHGGIGSREIRLWWIVDVRDVAEALSLNYEKPEAEGRYICASYGIHVRDLVEKLKSIYPEYDYNDKCVRHSTFLY